MTTSPSESRQLFPEKSEAESHPDMQPNNSKKKKKKKRVSKHVIQALKDKEEIKLQLQKQQQEQPLGNPSSQSANKKKKKEKKTVKDPTEAAQYLTTWNKNRNEWKFNKNTQSWLIRHMYESDKINKNTFVLLLEYLKGLQGGGSTKTRILAEATRRAFRYKEYQKNNQQQQSTEEDEQEGELQKEAGTSSGGDKKTGTASSDNGVEDDETRWKALSDHDKRKEYKRARKVLETLKE